MISEFAVEPEVMARWANFQTLWGDFGIAQRRQVGLYPKAWKRCVMEQARQLVREKINTDIQVAKMEDRLSGAASKPKFRNVSCSDWSEERAWIANALFHEPAFAAIVSSCPDSDERVVAINDLLRDEAPYYQTPEVEIERSADTIVGMLWPLLIQSSQIILVDPNFDPRESRFVNVVEKLVDRLHEAGKCPAKLEVHTTKYRHENGQRIIRLHQRHFQDTLGPILYGGWKIDVCCWAENAISDYQHPRFVLTEIGGIHLDWGLDTGVEGATTIAKGLGEQIHSTLFARYSSGSPAFCADGDNIVFRI